MACGRPCSRNNRWKRRLTASPRTSGSAVTAEQVAAEMIEDGQRVAIKAVAHQELALEVDRPDLVGRGSADGCRTGMLPTPPSVPRYDPAVALKDVEDRAAGGPGPSWVACPQTLEDLPRSPAVAAVLIQDQPDRL